MPFVAAPVAWEETSNVVADDDDDQVMVPAAPMSSLGYGMEHHGMSRVKEIVLKRKLEFRRTMIPIYLTFGLLLLVIASLRFMIDPESVLAVTLAPVWAPIVLALVGIAMISLSILTMLQVKEQLEKQAAAPSPQTA
jgi:hypothetical protein